MALDCPGQQIDGRVALPNVVILLADDLGSKDIGCYGGPVKTPTLDSLAAKGVRFTNFYSAAPVCSTARASLLTGRHHIRTGVYAVIQDHLHDMHLKTEEVTIAEILKGQGYNTAHIGKWHLGTPFRGRKKPWIDEHGFDYWFATDLNAAPSHRNPSNFWRNRERVGPLAGYSCQLVVDEAIQWLEKEGDSDTPFFLNIWFHEPHAPLAAPDDIVKEYGATNDPAAKYSATIDNTDRAISRLVKKLEQSGRLENTIIIYLSDHGSYRHERNGSLKAGKGSLYDGGLRTPGIVFWPRCIKGGRVESTPAGMIDLLPTICGLVGSKKPKDIQLDGVDLSDLLLKQDGEFKRSKPLTWHSPNAQPVVGIRDGKYSLVGFRAKEYPKDKPAIDKAMEGMRVILEEKLGRKLSRSELWHQCYNSPIRTPDWKRLRSQFVMLNTFQERWTPLIKSGWAGFSRFELYDLSVDPSQTNNLINKLPSVASSLKQKVMGINADVLDEGPVWGQVKDEKLKIHRLKSSLRSRFDAFVYVNRIPIKPEDDETQDDLAGRILSRLANQEGRVQIKLPPGMNRLAYNGFKFALEYESKADIGSCFRCHHLPNTGKILKPASPSLRNRKYTVDQLNMILKNKTHRDIKKNAQEVEMLHAFLQTLSDVPDSEFRSLIIKSNVMKNSGDRE